MTKNYAGKTLRGRPFSPNTDLRNADFNRAKLRGVDFKGLDLSGANFQSADIRGANFTKAILQGVNFTGAKAGLQKRWIVNQLIILFLLLIIFLFTATILSYVLNGLALFAYFFGGIVTTLSGIYNPLAAAFTEFFNPFFPYIAVSIILIVNITILVTIARQGLTARAFGTIITLMAISVTVTVVIFVGILVVFILQLVAKPETANIAINAYTFGFLSGFICLVIFMVALLVAGASAVVAATAVTSLTEVVVSRTPVLIFLIAFTFFVPNSSIIVFPILWLSSRIASQSIKGNEKFAVVRTFAIAFTSIGGTNFYKADLTGTDFTNAILKSTNLQDANLNKVYWKNAQDLERSRWGNSYLKNPQIRQLVITLKGQEQNFDRQDFRGINLQGANLKYASFIDTDLSQANLQDANLFEAKLVRTNLEQAILVGACLTGSYIEDWGITRKTKLDDITCDYVYLKLPIDSNRDPNRMPPVEQGNFSNNDFNTFITSVLDTLDLYHKQNINAGIAVTVLKGLTKDYPVQFEIVGLEKRGDNQFLIRLKVFGEASHFELQREYYARYEQTLPLYDPKKLLPDTDVVVAKMIETVKQNPGTRIENLHNRGIFVSRGTFNMVNQSSNEGNNVYVGGDVTGSTINLGKISGSVSNVVNQLPSSLDPAQPGIKELLIQLQQAVDEDTDLAPEDKADLLEQVKALAEAGQTPEQEKKKGLVRNARKIFDATLKSLPNTANIIEACSKLLPLILKALGLPA
jgi:uncharacterized protein YjbI with pentapeptide repeats